ncbi:MAG: type II toxin-antitoxin system VapC family toxin [Candidatus Latescibacteria bacterium]|nr:type II toxin-antitoxin system VapC family toxin [Candidatus Latescibacterota bacterium]
MKQSVYIETSIFSYLTAHLSRNLITAAWQQITFEWWSLHRNGFELYISELVVAEAERGDTQAAEKRLAELHGIPELSITEEAIAFAEKLIKGGALPHNAADDAMHISVAAVHGIDYLLTWNCRHINNAEMKPFIRKICNDYGYIYPEICTPQELMGEINDE